MAVCEQMDCRQRTIDPAAFNAGMTIETKGRTEAIERFLSAIDCQWIDVDSVDP